MHMHPTLPSDAGQMIDAAAAIRAEHQAAQAAASQAVAHAIRCGELLLQVKASLPHGAFGPWLADNVTFSDRTARGYMRLADLDASKRQHVADMSLRAALTSIADHRGPLEGAPENATKDSAIDWERPHRGCHSAATWIADGWYGLARVTESETHPGHFDLSVLVGANEAYTRRPVRGDGVGACLALMGVPESARWNDPDELARAFDAICETL